MAAKTARNAYHYARQSLLLPMAALAPFVWGALTRLSGVGKAAALCGSVLLVLLLFVVGLSPLEYAPRLLDPLAPLLTVVGVIMLDGLRSAVTRPGVRSSFRWITAAMMALAVLEMMGAVVAARRERVRVLEENSVASSRLQEVRRWPEGWAVADYPAYYAWHTGERFVWFPVVEDLDRARWRSAGPSGAVLWSDRWEDDPTGIAATRNLVRMLEADGWQTVHSGGLVVLSAP
jgi:hypothetical protein